MTTATHGFVIEDPGESRSLKDASGERRPDPSPDFVKPLRQWTLAAAFGVMTGPVALLDPSRVNHLAGSASIQWEVGLKTGRRVSRIEARRLALGVLYDARSRRHTEREREFERTWLIWHEE